MYAIDITIDALEDLQFFRKHEQERIFDQIEKQLTHQPMLPARNRKLLRPNVLAAWELRIDPFRVFYNIVVAVGRKEGNRLLLQGVEYSL
jgi:mRNA-degrading endonuclease RelE of RelBE toxin-antitoxin system